MSSAEIAKDEVYDHFPDIGCTRASSAGATTCNLKGLKYDEKRRKRGGRNQLG